MGSVLKAHPKAHPDTERAHSDNLYHNDNPPPQWGSGRDRWEKHRLHNKILVQCNGRIIHMMVSYQSNWLFGSRTDWTKMSVCLLKGWEKCGRKQEKRKTELPSEELG